MNNYLTGHKKRNLSLRVAMVLVFVCLCVALIFSINFRVNARSTGQALGMSVGTFTGRAMGSLQGLTEGQISGSKAGKEAGLSAEDTTAEIYRQLQLGGRLEVLVASGTYTDILKLGKDETPAYAALLSCKYNAVFTVDLAGAEVTLAEDGLHILLDEPELKFNPQGTSELEAEHQKGKYTGTTKDGFEAYINSANEVEEKGAEMLLSDESLTSAAKSSAEKQIKQLVNVSSLSKPNVTVTFRGEEGSK